MRTCLQCGRETDDLHCPADGMATYVQGARPASAVLTEGTVFAARYRINGVLGRGGMGAVYDAQHTGTGHAVAIKTLLLDSAGDVTALRRFFQEARMTAALQHPNTVRVFDFGQSDEGVVYLAMERLRGETLADLQVRLDAQHKRMTQEEAGRIAIDVLRSLAEAHQAGLVHRDLKPANIYLHDMGTGERVVKVLDFGIAKSNDAHLTKTGTSIGTPSYMSPEQVMSGEVDGRSDLYALGVILYGCVVGTLPFQADSSYSMMMKHVAEPAPDLNALRLPGITPAFASIVQKAMEKKPEDRFATAQAMRVALEQALAAAHSAESAKPPEPVAPEPASAKPAPRPAAQPPAPRSAGAAALLVGGIAAATAMAAVGVWWSVSHGDNPAPTAADAGASATDAATAAEPPPVDATAPSNAQPTAAPPPGPDVAVAPAVVPAPDVVVAPDVSVEADAAVAPDIAAEPDVPAADEPDVAPTPKPVVKPRPRPQPPKPVDLRAPGHSDRAPGNLRAPGR